jgi:glucan endo-1,3-beta-D-glucosidase
MYHISRLVVAVAAVGFPTALGAAVQGFNYGANAPDGRVKMKTDYTIEFNTAKSLVGAPANGFTSARLFTMRVSHIFPTSSSLRELTGPFPARCFFGAD